MTRGRQVRSLECGCGKLGAVELRQLEYFVAVAETLNFGRAAEELGVGQPAVSQQVARLERELGVRLLNRSSRVVQLSEAGQRFLPEARTVLVAAEHAAAVAAGDEARSGRRTIRVGTSTGMGEWLDLLLEALRRSDPDVDLELFRGPTRVRLERVRAGQLEAAFVRGPTSAAGLEIVPVWEDPLVVALPAEDPLAARAEVDLCELARLPLRIVSRTVNPPLVDLVMSACATAGFEPVLGPRSTHLEDTLAAIGAGAGWTVLYAVHARALRSERVAFRPVAAPSLEMTTGLAVREGATTRSLAPLLRACVQAADIHQRS